MEKESLKNVALLIVDPYNDFLAEGGKLWSLTRKTVEEVGLVEQLRTLLLAARTNGIQVVYVPHRQSAAGDYLNWKFLSPTQQGGPRHG